MNEIRECDQDKINDEAQAVPDAGPPSRLVGRELPRQCDRIVWVKSPVFQKLPKTHRGISQ